MKKLLKNEKGSYAIISVILVFVILTCISVYTDMIGKRWTINEVQAIMDTSGTNTLKSKVDLNNLYKEKFGTEGGSYADINDVDERGERLTQIVDAEFEKEIKDAYIDELKNQMIQNDNIKDVQFKDVQVSFDYDTFGLGKSETPRPQFTIESVLILKVKVGTLVDGLDGLSRDVYSSRNNTSLQVEYQGQTKEGEDLLFVRSATRLVYR